MLDELRVFDAVFFGVGGSFVKYREFWACVERRYFGATDTLVSFWASTLRYTTDDVTYAFSHIHLRGEFGGLMFNMYIRRAILRP
jgi:hypothetical protein